MGFDYKEIAEQKPEKFRLWLDMNLLHSEASWVFNLN